MINFQGFTIKKIASLSAEASMYFNVSSSLSSFRDLIVF